MMFSNADLKPQLNWYTRAEWALAVLALLIGGSIWYCWIKPEQGMLKVTHARIAIAERGIADNEKQARSLPRVEREIQRLGARVELFDEKLPAQENLASFISDISRAGQATALSKLSWNLDASPVRKDHYIELPILISFEGDFKSGVFAFLQRTEALKRLIHIQNLELQVDDAQAGRVTAQVTMNIFFEER